MLEILVVDDEPDIREAIALELSEHGHRVQLAADGEGALSRIEGQVFDLVIADVRLPAVDGFTLFRRLKRSNPSTQVALITAFGTVADAVTAMKEEAAGYLTKPLDVEELLELVGHVEEQRRLKEELKRAHALLAEIGPRAAPKAMIVGQSPAIVALQEHIDAIAASENAVLVTGESGTGKELIARTIHERSPRREKPLVVLNCAAFPDTLIEAELFGHERGAFTGALRRREGRFQEANGATLFLDEIAELSLPAQAKLLRVLQEGTFQPLGSNATLRVDVRLISATNRDLKKLIADGRFREDLFYRIKLFHLHVPPLRSRRGDLPLLVDAFCRRYSKEAAPPTSISQRAWAALSQYPFPGNVRELEHAVRHALVLSPGQEIQIEHLPDEIRGSCAPPAEEPLRPLAVTMREHEQAYLLKVLQLTGGNRVRAAEILGISRKNLWEKLRAHGIRGRQ